MNRCDGRQGAQRGMSVAHANHPGNESKKVIEVVPTESLNTNGPFFCSAKSLSECAICLYPLRSFGYIKKGAHSMVGSAVNAAKETVDVGKAFLSDFASTTANTFSNALFSESSARMAGFIASLSQAGLVLAESQVGELPVSIDAVTPLLRKAGIEVSNMTSEELYNLSLSVAALHLGKSQTISLEKAKFRYHKPFSGYSIEIGDICLEKLQPMKNTLVGDANRFGFEAEQLSMTLSYIPHAQDNAEGSVPPKPTSVKLMIPGPKVSAETNLLGLVGAYSAHVAELLKSCFPGRGEVEDKSFHHFMVDEKTGIDVCAKLVTIDIIEPGTLLEGFAKENSNDNGDEGSTLVFHDLHFSQENLQFVGVKPMVDSRPVVRFGLVEMDRFQVGGVGIKDGFVCLDAQANGSMRFTFVSDFKGMDEYCPEWLPKCVRKMVTSNRDANKKCIMCLDLMIQQGVVDLDRLWVTGFNEGGVSLVQKLLTRCVEATLNSKKTRIATDQLELTLPLSFQNDMRLRQDDLAGGFQDCGSTGGGVVLPPESHRRDPGKGKGLGFYLKSIKDKVDKNGVKIKKKYNKTKKKLKNSDKVIAKTCIQLPEDTKVFRSADGARGKIDLFALAEEYGFDWE